MLNSFQHPPCRRGYLSRWQAGRRTKHPTMKPPYGNRFQTRLHFD